MRRRAALRARTQVFTITSSQLDLVREATSNGCFVLRPGAVVTGLVLLFSMSSVTLEVCLTAFRSLSTFYFQLIMPPLMPGSKSQLTYSNDASPSSITETSCQVLNLLRSPNSL